MIIEEADLEEIAQWAEPRTANALLGELRYVRRRGGLVLAARDDRIIGYVQSRVDEGSAFIRQVDVDPDVRQQGVATALYDAIVDRSGCDALAGSVSVDNVPAVRFHDAYRRRHEPYAPRFFGGPWVCRTQLI